MGILMSLSLAEWIILIVIFAVCSGACWLNYDSRKRGLPTGGKACGGCPHYCQIGRNCDGNLREERIESGKTAYTHVSHTFKPVYDENSRILVLGSFPSVKSRENDFYYGHPQNRFWKLMARLLEEPVPQTVQEKKDMLLRHRIAIWDVIASCDIKGSSDSSIRNVTPADINRVLRAANIEKIIANGSTAYSLYKKYCEARTGREAVKCPSTSPANAVFTLGQLADEWSREMDLGPGG